MPYTNNFVAQSGVVFLALAYEIPVVASEAGGLGDLLREFRIGQTFPDATPQTLAQAVRRLHAGEGRGALIAQIRQAKSQYSWRDSAQATLAGYSTVQDHFA